MAVSNEHDSVGVGGNVAIRLILALMAMLMMVAAPVAAIDSVGREIAECMCAAPADDCPDRASTGLDCARCCLATLPVTGPAAPLGTVPIVALARAHPALSRFSALPETPPPRSV